MSDTEREALARLLRAVAAVEKMLPHGPDRYELTVAAQEIAAGWRRAPQPADGWRPIETAPRDGTRILLGRPNYSSEAKAREIARRCVERPYNQGTVEKATAIIAAALAAERVEAAARLLPEYAAAIRALPYPAPTAQAEPAATSGGGQPADRARWYLALSDDEARQHATETIAEEFAEAVLAAEARVAEQAREIERLRAGLQEDLSFHEEQVAAWSEPEAGDPDERDHHQRRVDVLRAALEAGR